MPTSRATPRPRRNKLLLPPAEDVLYVVHLSRGCWRPPLEDVFIEHRELVGQHKDQGEAMSIASRAIFPYEYKKPDEGWIMMNMRDRRLDPPDDGFLVRLEDDGGEIIQVELTKTRTCTAVPSPPPPATQALADVPCSDPDPDPFVPPNKKPRIDVDTPMFDIQPAL